METLGTGHPMVQGRTALELAATTQAIIAADAAYLREGIESVQWERHGFLQRLCRADRSTAEAPAGLVAADLPA
jgi:hypothetical protein